LFDGQYKWTCLKIELSMAGRYAADKQAVLERVKHMSALSTGVVVKVEHSVRAGIDLIPRASNFASRVYFSAPSMRL
jgi:hypothetical protein